MPSALQVIPLIFKKIQLATNKSTAVEEPQPPTADHITVSQFSRSSSLHNYDNEPCTGWRNWVNIGNTVYAQHPTHDWFVKVDNLRVFSQMIEEHKSVEELRLVLYVHPPQGLVLAPYDAKSVVAELSQDLQYTRLRLKNQKELDVIRFIQDVSIHEQLVHIIEIRHRMYSKYSIPWVEVLDKFTMTKEQNPHILAEIALAKHPLFSHEHLITELYYNSQRRRFQLDSTWDTVTTAQNQIFNELAQVGVDITPDGANVTVSGDDAQWDEAHIEVTPAQLFHLSENGWFFSQWLTPRTEINYYNPLYVDNRKIRYLLDEEETEGVLQFQYSVSNGQHRLDISEELNYSLNATFQANSFVELANQVRDWILNNLLFIEIQVYVTYKLNQNLETEYFLITM